MEMLSTLNSIVNNATNIWSGAVDVIAIKQKDGTILCSPFYIQVGKLKVLRPGEKIIRIMVNGKLTSLDMRIGSNGEGYFIHEVEEGQSISEDEVLSPISTPPSPTVSSSILKEEEDVLIPSPKSTKKSPPEPQEVVFSSSARKKKVSSWRRWVGNFFTKDQGKEEQEPIVKDDFVEAQLMESLKKEFDYDHNSPTPPQEKDTRQKEPGNQKKDTQRQEIDSGDQEKDSTGDDDLFAMDLDDDDEPIEPPQRSHTPPFNWKPVQIPFETSPRSLTPKTPPKKVKSPPKKTRKRGKSLAVNIPVKNKSFNDASFAHPISTLIDPETIHQLTPSLPPHMKTHMNDHGDGPSSLPRNFGRFSSDSGHATDHFTPPGTQSFTPSKWSSWWSGSYSSKDDIHHSPPQKKLKKSNRPTSNQLRRLHLKNGKNTLKFIVQGRVLGTQTITADLYLWNHDDRIVISDVDGTITKSDAMGHILPRFNIDWSHIGVAKLYNAVEKNGYKIMYLTARSIVQSHTTKEYLEGLKQNKLTIPEGPCIMSSDRILHCLTREVILRKPEQFKIATLMDIKNLFPDSNSTPFYAGFGNRITDEISYEAVGIPKSRIYIVNTMGKVTVLNSIEHGGGYTDLAKIVDMTFPDLKAKNNKDSATSFWALDAPTLSDYELDFEKLDD